MTYGLDDGRDLPGASRALPTLPMVTMEVMPVPLRTTSTSGIDRAGSDLATVPLNWLRWRVTVPRHNSYQQDKYFDQAARFTLA